MDLIRGRKSRIYVVTNKPKPILGIMACWAVVQHKDNFYISGLRAGYLEHFASISEWLYVLVPTKSVTSSHERADLQPINIDNITFVPLPALPTHGAYVASIKHFFAYRKKIAYVKARVTDFYCQTPDPFCWLPTLMRCPNVTMHHVGSSVDATWRSSRPFLIRVGLVLVYFPEFLAILMASKFSRVVCNGSEISRRLKRYRIKHETVISSTINEDDICKRQILQNLDKRQLELLYVGYLRPSKGLRKIIESLALLKNREIAFRARLVGDGEERQELVSLVDELGLRENIEFYGHIDNRNQLREIYNSSDIFLFMSNSEGSPRVIIEAMASTLLVISTRVGSLPSVFCDGRELLFVDNSDIRKLVNIT